MKKSKTPATVTVNRRARFDYQLGDELSCGTMSSSRAPSSLCVTANSG